MFLWECVAKNLKKDLDKISDISDFSEEEQEVISFFGLEKWKEILLYFREKPIFLLAVRLQEEQAFNCCDFSLETGKFAEYLKTTFIPTAKSSEGKE